MTFGFSSLAIRILPDVTDVPCIMPDLVTQDRSICLTFSQSIGIDMLSVKDGGCRPALIPQVADEHSLEVLTGFPLGHYARHSGGIHNHDGLSLRDMYVLVGDAQ